MSFPFLPICFVVMPFGVRDTGAAEPAPARIDFDALWLLAIKPALERLGYRAVRADQDLGPLIIQEMLERLYYSDLVVADISVANANAYYEVGIRHAARPDGCVLIAADWARPVFDLAQIRHVPYPNAVAKLDPGSAQPIIDVLVESIPPRARSRAPMMDAVLGYPNAEHDGARARELAGQLEAFETLRADIDVVGEMPEPARTAAAREILDAHPAGTTTSLSVATEMIRLLRDVLERHQEVVTYVQSLPQAVQDLPYMQERLALAQSKHGDHLAAIRALKTLIRLRGDSAERQGLLGGRYKRLYNESVKAARDDASGVTQPNRRHLQDAIRHYEEGMQLDLNDYYPICNLPALYRERGDAGDEARAVVAATVARMGCERAIVRRTENEWTRSTLLGMAFAERNLDAARELAPRIEREGAIVWQMESTLQDLRRHVEQMTQNTAGFAEIVARLETMR